MLNDKGTQVLIELGLTLCEAKVYLTLVKSGVSPVKSISKAAHVVRQDTYRILSSLQERGLVEKVIADPAVFKPIPIRDALSVLWEKRKQENSELQTGMKELLHRTAHRWELPEEGEYNFSLIHGKASINKIRKIFDNTQVSFDVIISLSVVARGEIYFQEYIRRMVKRGVRIRQINEELGKELQGPKIWKLLKSPNVKARYVRHPIEVSVGIHDNREAIVHVYLKSDNMPVPPSIWSNNPSFVTLCRDHFEKIWKTAHEYPD